MVSDFLGLRAHSVLVIMTEANLLIPSRVSRLAGLLPTTIVAVVAAMVVAVMGTSGSNSAAPAALESSVATAVRPSVLAEAGQTPISLQLPRGTVTAVLDNSSVAHQLAAALPLRLRLHDPMGQAKSGQLPVLLDTDQAESTLDPEVGGIYYWPPSGDIAIFYDDLGQTVPPPGLVRLGTVTGDIAEIARAGRRFDLSIVPA